MTSAARSAKFQAREADRTGEESKMSPSERESAAARAPLRHPGPSSAAFVRLPRFARGQAIGLLGGSFNPPHDGHRLISELALHRLRLDRLWWLATPGNPLKSAAGLTEMHARLEAAERLARDPRITITGFEVPEIDLIIEEAKTIADRDDSFEISNEGPGVSQYGDLWTLGRHRILCGNSLEPSSYKAALGPRTTQIVGTRVPTQSVGTR